MTREMRLQSQSTLKYPGESAAPILTQYIIIVWGIDTVGKSAPKGDDGLAGQKIFENPIHNYLRAHLTLSLAATAAYLAALRAFFCGKRIYANHSWRHVPQLEETIRQLGAAVLADDAILARLIPAKDSHTKS